MGAQEEEEQIMEREEEEDPNMEVEQEAESLGSPPKEVYWIFMCNVLGFI